jgi:hypothetical protein
MLIIKCRCISAYSLIPYFSLLLPYISFIFLHLLSNNHKCTQPCYFPLLLKPAAQKKKMDWNSSTRSSRLLVFSVPFLRCYGVFRCSVPLRVVLVFKDIIYVIIILYAYDIWLSVSTFTRMSGTIDSGSCIR